MKSPEFKKLNVYDKYTKKHDDVLSFFSLSHVYIYICIYV